MLIDLIPKIYGEIFGRCYWLFQISYALALYISPNKIAEFSIATKLYLIGAIASFEVTAQHTLVFRQDASNNVSPD